MNECLEIVKFFSQNNEERKKKRQQECERERDWARETGIEKRRESKPKKERCLSLEYTLQLLLKLWSILIG